MTLVLSVLTRHEVIQVSDRRFTYSRADGSVFSRNDEKNKSILYCGRLMFGFTGRGDLGPKRRSDIWLAQTICEVIAERDTGDQGQILQGIAERCTALFARAYRGQRHAFVGAGWANFIAPGDDEAPASGADFSPYLAVISNFHESGAELPEARDGFGVWLRPLGMGEGGFVWDAPGHLSREEMDLLTRRVEAADRRRSPLMIAEHLAWQVKQVAARDPNVGEGLMISVLPRASLGAVPGIMAVAGPPDAETQSFLYVPPSGDTTVQLGPVTTCGGGITSDFEARPMIEDPGPTPRPDDPPGLARRWYIAPIVGSGTEEDPYMTLTLGHGGVGPIESGENGHPLHEQTVVLISSTDHAGLRADPRIRPIADLADLDLQIQDLEPERAGWIRAIAEAHGIEAHGLVREVLREIGGKYQTNFDESLFWVR